MDWGFLDHLDAGWLAAISSLFSAVAALTSLFLAIKLSRPKISVAFISRTGGHGGSETVFALMVNKGAQPVVVRRITVKVRGEELPPPRVHWKNSQAQSENTEPGAFVLPAGTAYQVEVGFRADGLEREEGELRIETDSRRGLFFGCSYGAKIPPRT